MDCHDRQYPRAGSGPPVRMLAACSPDTPGPVWDPVRLVAKAATPLLERADELAALSPYERALALADGDNEDALRMALDELQRLEAAPAGAIVARRLRERGARGVPRGSRPATRQTQPS
jgi:hypothetical protein